MYIILKLSYSILAHNKCYLGQWAHLKSETFLIEIIILH